MAIDTPPPTRAPAPPVEPEPFDYESIPPGYYDRVFARGAGVQSKWHRLKFERVLRELRGHHRVLDIGCGPGTLAGMAAEEHDWVGTDLSSHQIAYARSTYGPRGPRFYRARPSTLPEEEGVFDALTMVELIEHLDPELVDETIAEGLERLRPGGKLVLTTPNFHSLWPLMEAAVDRFGEVSYAFQHINKFDRRLLAALLERHGLEQARAEPFLFLAPFAAAASWQAADRVAALERRGIERRFGLLLVGTAFKPG